MPGQFREDLSTFILLTVLRNIVYLNNSAKRGHSCVSIATMNTFTLLTDTGMSETIQIKSAVALSLHNDSANASQCCVIVLERTTNKYYY
jgi:hypothetical protein